MLSFKVYFIPKKHTPLQILHLAMQTYLNFFNDIASNDKENSLPKDAYKNAEIIKHTDDTFLGKNGPMFSADKILDIFYALGYYSHFFSLYINRARARHTFDNEAEYSFICTIKMMFSISDFISNHHSASVLINPAKDVLNNCPVPKKLVHVLVKTMHGQKVSN